MLGVSALSAWRYWSTPAALRAALPWYTSPWFWGPGLALVLVFALNTVLGSAVPGLKKPLDFLELHENQISALVASPIVAEEIVKIVRATPSLAGLLAAPGAPALASAGLAAIGSGAAARLFVEGLAAVAGLVAFASVFLAFHVLQVMIALSPSALLDFLLRLVRFVALGAMGVATWIHPFFGAALGLVALAVALPLAGWSFRLAVFGSVFSLDLLFRVGSGDADARGVAAFAGRKLAGVKTRSYGRIEGGREGALRFRYRPWLVLATRTVEIPRPGLALLEGFTSPALVRLGGVREPVLARFAPRYRGREAALAARFGFGEVREGRVLRGLRAAWRSLRDLVFGDGPVAAPEPVRAPPE